jgi:exosome complex RNA-binding protein Csl4
LNTSQETQGDDEDFAALLAESLSQDNVKEGEILRGTVIAVGKDYAMSTCCSSRVRTTCRHGRPLEGEGRSLQGLGRDQRRVRTRRADRRHHHHAREGRPVGHHPRRREGVLAGLAGRPAPGAQPRQVLGQTFNFKVIKFNKKRGNIVLSRRVLLEKERAAEGVDARAPEGGPDRRGRRQEPHRVRCVHRPRRHRRPAPHHRHELGPGQPPVRAVPGRRQVTVKVLKFNADTERVSLGLKQITEDPWSRAAEKYVPGTVVRGKVVSLKDYGAFIELERASRASSTSPRCRGPAASSTRRRWSPSATWSRPSSSTSTSSRTASRSA